MSDEVSRRARAGELEAYRQHMTRSIAEPPRPTAADPRNARITALEAENRALRERNAALEDGLRPFAKVGDWYGGAEFQRARALLQGQGGADASGR